MSHEPTVDPVIPAPVDPLLPEPPPPMQDPPPTPNAPPAAEAPLSEERLSELASVLGTAKDLLWGVGGLVATAAPVSLYKVEASASADRAEISGGRVYEYDGFVVLVPPGTRGVGARPPVLVSSSIQAMKTGLGSRYSLTKLSPSDLAVALPDEPFLASSLRSPAAKLMELEGLEGLRSLLASLSSTGATDGDAPPAGPPTGQALRSWLLGEH